MNFGIQLVFVGFFTQMLSMFLFHRMESGPQFFLFSMGLVLTISGFGIWFDSPLTEDT